MAKAKESYEEWKNRKEQEGTLPASTTQRSATSAGSSYKPKESYEEWKARKEGKTSSNNLITSFLTDSRAYLSSAQKEYDSLNYQTGKSTYVKRMTDAERLKARGRQIQQYIDRSGNSSEYADLKKYLEEFEKSADNVLDAFRSSADFYGQFDSEEKYNEYAAYQKDREEKSVFDLDAGQKEIAAMEQELAELKRQKSTDDSVKSMQNLYSGSTYAAAQGDIKSDRDLKIREMEQQISSKKQYLNDAKRIQDGATLASVSGNDDFDAYKGYVSTKNDSVRGQFGMGYDDLTYEYINGEDNGMRQSIINKVVSYDADTEKFFSYDHMTPVQIAIYNYHYAKDGKEAAEKYLNSIQETLNDKAATERFEKMKDRTALELVFGLEAGLDQFQSGVKNLFNTKDDYIPQTAKQMASGLVREDLADAGPKLPSWMGGASLGQVGYDAITTTANMAPSILASTVIGTLFPGTIAIGAQKTTAGAIAGSALMGGSAAGNAYQEALNEGYDKNQARGYGLLVGASETVMENVLGGISAVGGNALGKYMTQNVGAADTALKMIGKRLGASGLSEFTEEYLQEVLTPVFQNIMLDTNNEVKLFSAEALYSGILGALTAGIMEGPTAISGEVRTNRIGKQLKAAGVSAQRLADIGKTFAADTVAYQLAGKVDENTNAYTMGRLFNEIGATLTEQNVSDITEALVAKGWDRGVAAKNAKVMAAVVDGEKLSDKEVAIIEANDSLAEAMRTTIVDPNATWFQRNKGYNDIAMTLAQKMTVPKSAKTKQSLPGQENADVTDKVDTQEENGAESEYEVSAKGKTILKSTGKTVSIKEVADINDGKMMLRLEDGSTVDAGEVSYASQDEALVYETVAQMGASVKAANILVNGFKAAQGDGLSASVYAHGIDEAFQYGKLGIPIRELARSTFASKLNVGQQEYVYRQGQRVAGKQVAKDQATVSQKGNAATTEKTSIIGKVHFDRNGRTFDSVREVSLTTMEQLSKTLGVEFYVFESYMNENGERVYKDADGNEVSAPNGYYDPKDGSIHIDLNAGNGGKGTMLFTIAHELTHFIKQWSPAKFKVLANFLVKHYGEKGVSVDKLVDAQIAKAKKDGRKINREEAYEEMVADSMETMLTDGNVVQMMADLKQQDRSLWKKICDWFKDLAADLQALVDAYKGVKPDSKEGKMVAQMQDVIVILESLYADALADAGENYHTAKVQKNTTEDGGVDGEYDIKLSPRMEEAFKPYAKEINSVVNQSISGKGNIDGKAQVKDIMPTGPKITAMVAASSGNAIDISQRKIALSTSDIWHEFKRHTSVGAETSRGQIAFTKCQFQNAVKCIISPDMVETIFADTNNPTQKQSFAYAKKTSRGNYVVVEAVGGKKNPHIYPVMILQFSKDKWDKMMSQGKTLGEILFENDAKKLQALDIQKNKKSRVTAAQFASYEAIANTLRSPQLDTKVSQPDEEVKKKFSLREPVEHTKNLVALHNLTEEKLAKTLELGGFPMPSIAITKADIPHTNFGDITLVFGRDTVDPKVNRKNTVYSADAWTPVFPRTEYEADSKVESRISQKLRDLGNKVDDYFQADLRRVSYGFEHYLDRYDGEEGLVQHVMDNYGMKAAYLEDSGKHIEKVTKLEKAKKDYNPDNADKYQKIMDILGVTTADEISKVNLKDARDNHGTELEAVYPGITASGMLMGRLFGIVKSYLESKDSGPIYNTVTDGAATQRLIDEALDSEGYEVWVRNLFSGIVKDSGIYNNKDRFTPSGNRRTFKQTHLPVTLENIVKAMATQNGGSTKNVSGFNGIKTLRAGTAERFKSIEAMHQREGRLKNLSQEQLKEINDTLQSRLYRIIEAIDNENGGKGESNSFFRYDTIGNIITEISEGGKYNIAEIQRIFEQYSKEISDDTAQEVKELLYDVTQMPVNIFEAKPERVVGIDEIKAAILPRGTDQKIIDRLQQSGVSVRFYESGNDAERLQLVNAMEDVKFSGRDREAEKVSKVLQKENDKLKEDVQYLKELLKLQKSVTGGTMFTKTSVESAAGLLLKSANAKGDKRELAKLLDGFYGYIAKGEELTWEGVSEAAQPAVDWLQSHVETKKQLDAFAADVLRELRGRRIYLDETQKKEAAYKFGSYNEYRKKMMGTVIFTDNGSVSLDSMWNELSSLYPSVFDPNTNATDMPEALMDAVDRLRNMDVGAYEYAYDDDMMAHDLIRQVYDTYWNVSTLKTVADVKQKEINRLKGEHINRMTKLKEYHKEKTEQLKKEHKEELKRVREEYRQNAKEQQQKIVDKYQESRKKAVAKVRETAEKRDAKAKLQKLVLDTVKWISHPAKTAVKCPDLLKQPYSDFLNSIDMSSERLAKGGDPTKNDLRLANAMGSLATALEKIMASQDPTQDTAAVLDAGYLDLPANFVQKLRDMTEDVKAMMVEGEYVVNAMTAEEVRKLSQMIRTLNHAIKEVSTLYANLRFANVEMLGDESMAFMDAIGEIQKTSGMKDFVQWENALPYYAFKRFGKGGESIFEGLMDAQDKLAFLAQNIFNFQEKTWKGDEAKKWSEDTHTIDLPDGEQLTLTTADAMSIYCLSRRQQGLQHLLGGGVRVMGIKKDSQKAKDSRSTLTIKDIDAIISSLTDRQKKVAEAIQEFMSTTCSEWGNEISMKRFLTKEFNEKFYFPIESNDENLPTKDPSAQQSDLFRLLNISATKTIDPRANNEVIIRNIFDVFTGHASDMARLNAFGLPLLDYMKWLNYREKTVNEEGQIKVRGVRKYMETAYGNAAKSYVLNLIKDVNGRPSDNGDPSILMKWMRSAKTASVGSSLRVATLQVTSYPRAALVLSPKSLALGLTKVPKIDKAKKYCGIALWKSFGFYDTNISRSIEEQMKGVKDVKQKLIELSLKGAELGDAITWGAMWNACEYEVASTKKYKVGSEEFYEAVAKKLREVVYRTQVVDSTLTRSQIMRSKRGMTQEAAAFMSEPTLSANILMDAGMEFNLEKRRTNAKTAWNKTGKYVTNALAVYSIGQLTAALLEGLWDAWRDDEDEKFGDKFVSAFTENLVMDLVPFNKIPIVSDVFEAGLAMIGVGFYSSDKMSTTWLTQAVSAADAWRDVIGGNSSVTTYNALYKSVRALSSFYGVSASGVMREGVDMWNNTAGAYDLTLKVLNYDRSKAELGSLLLDAIIEGNDRQADSLRAEFEDEDAYQSALRSAIKERYLAGEIDTSTAQEYLALYGGKDGSKAYWLTEEWMYESGSDEEFGKYNKFFDAVKTGKNLKAVIKEYTSNGVKPETLAGQITEHFKPEYVEMTRSEKASIKGYLLNAFEQCGVKREDAAKKLQYWEFLSEHPDSELNQSQAENYQEFAKPAGISVKQFADYCRKTKGISKKEDLMNVIDSLPINSAQKDALYYAEGWAKSKLNEAPWH